MISDDLPGRARNLRLGMRLREARTLHDMSLTDVERATSGRLKARTVAAYEHGTRAVSSERLGELAAIYDVDVEALLAPLRTGGHDPVVIDLVRLGELPDDDPVRRFVECLVDARGEPGAPTITLRLDDLGRLQDDGRNSLLGVSRPAPGGSRRSGRQF